LRRERENSGTDASFDSRRGDGGVGGTDGIQCSRFVQKVGAEDCKEVAEHEEEGDEQPKPPTDALQRVEADEGEAEH
jgi:hypothetical protein